MDTVESKVASGDRDPLALGDAFNEPLEPRADGWSGAPDGSDTTAAKMRQLALDKKSEERAKAPVPLGVTSHPSPTFRASSPSAPPRSASPKYLPGSPGRVPQTSPRLTSPTSSLIFERNVQEDVVPSAASPAIPAHITTENHIPPILEEASKAITDDHLDPDSVEIVTHAAHMPAAAVVTAGSEMPLTPLQPVVSVSTAATGVGESGSPPRNAPLESSFGSSSQPAPTTNVLLTGSSPPLGSDAGTGPASEDGSSAFGANLNHAASVPNYGSIADSTDVRRLSFISFADVVHAEQVVGGDAASIRDSMVLSPSAVPTSPPPIARSPSPLRSPVSPSLSAASGTGSGHAHLGEAESSPGRTGVTNAHGGLGGGSLQSSTLLHSVQGNSPPIGNTGGELTIETMRQALRKTASGDLSGVRSSMVLSDGSGEAQGQQ